MTTTTALVAHFFRHEYAKLVASLVRRVGVEHLDAVEDAAQTALTTALETWPTSSMPDNPTAWLFRVAHNALMSVLRQSNSRRRLAMKESADPSSTLVRDDPDAAMPDVVLAREIPDDLLRMMFVCCDDVVPFESQLTLALKTLCGFGVREIAFRLFTTEANIYKRLQRAKDRLREEAATTNAQLRTSLTGDETKRRVPSVNNILYLLFTEGHLSTLDDRGIREELVDDAIRLAHVLASHPCTQNPESSALLALMYLHKARMPARVSDDGGLVLLDSQDRSLFSADEISLGLSWLERSASGQVFTRFHAEAAIAAEHCLAPSFAATRWDRVAENYALLEQLAPSPLHRLNRAVAVAEWKGAEAGLTVVDGFEPPTWLEGSYLWSAVLADLHQRAGNKEKYAAHRSSALRLSPTLAIRESLTRRLG